MDSLKISDQATSNDGVYRRSHIKPRQIEKVMSKIKC